MENNSFSNNTHDKTIYEINKKVNDFIDLIKSKETSYSDEKILELVENYKKILLVNPQINIYNPSFNYKVFENEIFNKYNTNFINDILNYNVKKEDPFKTRIFIDNSQKETMIKLYDYLNENNIYSYISIQYIVKYFDKFEPLFNNLITNNYKLNEVEKNNLNLYINYIINTNDESIQINNIIDLQRYKDIIIENGFKKIEEDPINIKTNVLNTLFEDQEKQGELIKLSNNKYLQQRMKQNGLLDENDELIINIINAIQSDSFKDKTIARNLLKKSMIISQFFDNLYNKIKQYYQNRIDKKINITEKLVSESIEKKDVIYKEYQGKQISLIDMNKIYSNLEFMDYPCFLTTKLSDESTTGNRQNTTNGLTSNPELWNKLNITSTISCSLSSFFNKSFRGGQGDVILGFYDLPTNSMIGMKKSDASLSHGYNIVNPKMSNYFESPEKLIKNSSKLQESNEVGIYRKNANSKDERIQPKYLICPTYDIDNNVLEYASYFNIPIIIYDKYLYEEQHKILSENYKSGTKQNFNKNDAYAILSLKDISEEESMNLIINYLVKEKNDSVEYEKLLFDVKNLIVDYFIDNPNLISNYLEKIDSISDSYSQDEEIIRKVA